MERVIDLYNSGARQRFLSKFIREKNSTTSESIGIHVGCIIVDVCLKQKVRYALVIFWVLVAIPYACLLVAYFIGVRGVKGAKATYAVGTVFCFGLFLLRLIDLAWNGPRLIDNEEFAIIVILLTMLGSLETIERLKWRLGYKILYVIASVLLPIDGFMFADTTAQVVKHTCFIRTENIVMSLSALFAVVPAAAYVAKSHLNINLFGFMTKE